MLIDLNTTVDHFDFTVEENLSFTVESGTFVVKKGFHSDGASVPDFAWGIIPPFGKHLLAAVLHDKLYRTTAYDLTKKQADQIFHELMLQNGVSEQRAYLMYLAVRWFGNDSWVPAHGEG